MIKILNDTELGEIKGGFKHNIWYYYGWGRASCIGTQRRNPSAFLNHPNFIVLGGN
ncbi:hypothetical protein [uncultured Limosilactobacillus sp.]|uniref:hypothetical protein n=1 Tax=uncultured Limosilactobacillus sp. TaxID=2837629 RepID=UPI00265F33C9|nr:hypothetical protein [uncultured Limosilactobacillus sp.]